MNSFSRTLLFGLTEKLQKRYQLSFKLKQTTKSEIFTILLIYKYKMYFLSHLLTAI
jgi:hypothetical protein